jgi:hypothetical protein
MCLPVVALLAACGGGGGGGVGPSTPSQTPMPTTAPSASLVPSAGSIYLGAFVNTSGLKPPPESDTTTFEAQIGRTLALTIHYYGFYDAFPGAAEQADASAGRIPIESWNCQDPNATIAAGTDDASIARRADALRAYGRPIFLRYMWEMNDPSSSTNRPSCYSATTDDPNGVFSPTEFIAAWTHIRAIFAERGANNVVWLWNPGGGASGLPYYPGASETDWIGVDQYDYSSVSFAATFASSYQQLAPLGKPLLIAETGAQGPEQPAFLGAAAATLENQFPLVRGFVYFDSVGSAGTWTLTPSGITAFAAAGSDPYFSATPPP